MNAFGLPCLLPYWFCTKKDVAQALSPGTADRSRAGNKPTQGMPVETCLPGVTARSPTAANLFLIAFAGLLLSGCASSAASVATSVVLTAMGVKKDQSPPPPKNIAVHVDTANNLNADSQGRGLSAVLRIYKLKDATSFKQASSDNLFDPESAKALLGQDLLESKEALLIPGQHYQFKEKVDAQNGYLAIAIFFRKPNPQRWKLVVANSDLKENSPLIIGAYACAINVTSGLTDKKELAEKFYVASARCEQ